MCRKIKKLAWYTAEELEEKKLDYRFLELLVLFESKSDLADRLRKAGMTSAKYDDDFLIQLRPLLQDPSKHLAIYLKRLIHPEHEEEKMSPNMAAFLKNIQERAHKSSLRIRSRPRRDEAWTMVTPVPHIRCPCYTQRTYAPIVPKGERTAVEMQKTHLHYRQQTMGITSQRESCDVDYFIPRYRRLVSREPPPPRPKSVPTMPGVRRAANVFERLSTPKNRLPSQSPRCASAGDAYGRGILEKEGLGEASRAVSKGPKKLRRRKVKRRKETCSDFICLC